MVGESELVSNGKEMFRFAQHDDPPHAPHPQGRGNHVCPPCEENDKNGGATLVALVHDSMCTQSHTPDIISLE